MWGCPGPAFSSRAVGVGQSEDSREDGTPRSVSPPGEDEDALATMRGSDSSRGKHVPFRIEPERGQGSENLIESPMSESWDIFQEDCRGSHLANHPSNLEEEAAAGSGEPSPEAGLGNVLAREARSDEIHKAMEWSTVEGGEVVPDRSRCQGLLCHPRHEGGRCVGFPLNESQRSPAIAEDDLEAELEAADPGAEGEAGDGVVRSCGTKSHTIAAAHWPAGPGLSASVAMASSTFWSCSSSSRRQPWQRLMIAEL